MRLSRATAVAAVVVAGWWAAGPSAQAQPAPPPPPPGLAEAPATALKTTIDADGSYVVGTDIAPGAYQSAGPTDDGACYWKRTAGDAMVDNALTKKPAYVQILPTDTSFTTNDCQSWQLTDMPPPPQPGPGDLLGQLTGVIGRGMLSGGPH